MKDFISDKLLVAEGPAFHCFHCYCVVNGKRAVLGNGKQGLSSTNGDTVVADTGDVMINNTNGDRGIASTGAVRSNGNTVASAVL